MIVCVSSSKLERTILCLLSILPILNFNLTSLSMVKSRVETTESKESKVTPGCRDAFQNENNHKSSTVSHQKWMYSVVKPIYQNSVNKYTGTLNKFPMSEIFVNLTCIKQTCRSQTQNVGLKYVWFKQIPLYIFKIRAFKKNQQYI